MWHELDLEGNGVVSRHELLSVLEKLDVSLKTAELVFDKCDLDRDGYIGFKEFSSVVSATVHQNQEEIYKWAFD
jgi:Ca2+-binding EF-hand superfamily protein